MKSRLLLTLLLPLLVILAACDCSKWYGKYRAGYSFVSGAVYGVLDPLAGVDPGIGARYNPLKTALEAANSLIDRLCAADPGAKEQQDLAAAIANGAQLVSEIAKVYGDVVRPRDLEEARAWKETVAEMEGLQAEIQQAAERGTR